MIKKEDILNATNGGLDILQHLLPNLPPIKDGAKITKHFIVPWRDEKHSSTHLFRGDDNVWIFKDFGDGASGNVIDFIMRFKRIGFADAVKLCAEYANIPVPETKKEKELQEKVLTPDQTMVDLVKAQTQTAFHIFFRGLGITDEHLTKWGVGGSERGETAFVYIKEDQSAINIKYITYGLDGKRKKEVKPRSLTSTVKGEVYKLCLFGEHLLESGKTVCIVESEKTAVIASFFYPQYCWLATGGVFGAKKLDYARNGLADGRLNLVLLDADPIRKTPKAMEILLSLGATAETADIFPDRTDSTDIADYIIEGLRPEIVKDKTKVFWKKNNKDQIEIMPVRFARFLMENDFAKYYPEGARKSEFCKIEGKLVDTIISERIKDFVRTHVENYPEEIQDYFFKTTGLYEDKFLNGIGVKTFDIQRDTKDEAFIYYRNCVVKVTKDKIESIPYSKIGGYVWKKYVNDRDFTQKDDKISEYEQFITLASGNDIKKDAFKSAIGYMLHEFKDPSKAKCVILNDENVDGETKGGAGKGVFCKALSHIRRAVQISGKKFDPTNPFAYQRVSETTQIVEIADADKKMNFDALFNVVTDGFQVERKNKDEINIPPERSPKFIISTNHTIKGVGDAYARRRYDLEFTGYFHKGFTIADHFKHNLFSDWDEKEWGRFHNFMVECLQFFLKHGLVQDVYKTLKRRNFVGNAGLAFVEWCEMEGGPVSMVGTRFPRAELLASFLAINPDEKWMKWNSMGPRLIQYAEYADLKFIDGNTGGRWWEFHYKTNVKAESKTESSVKGIDYSEPPF